MSEVNEKLLNLGYGNYVMISRVVAILSSDSLPMKRLKEEAKKRSQLVDATQGRKTRSMVICDNNHLFLSGLTSETLSNRFTNVESES